MTQIPFSIIFVMLLTSLVVSKEFQESCLKFEKKEKMGMLTRNQKEKEGQRRGAPEGGAKKGCSRGLAPGGWGCSRGGGGESQLRGSSGAACWYI